MVNNLYIVLSLFCNLHRPEYFVSNHSLISKSVKFKLTQLHSRHVCNDGGLLYSLIALGFLLKCSESNERYELLSLFSFVFEDSIISPFYLGLCGDLGIAH